MHITKWVNGDVQNGNKCTCIVEPSGSDYQVKVDKLPVSSFLKVRANINQIPGGGAKLP